MTTPSVDVEFALHCLHANPRVSCPIIRERTLVMGKKDTLRDNDVSCAGRSIRETLEDKLDTVYDKLLDEDLGKKETALYIGMGEAYATAIALMLNPYRVDVEKVKDAAMERYEERQ